MPRKKTAQVRTYSLTEDRKRNTTRPYTHESLWGTKGSKASKKTISLALAKNPVLTWARDLDDVLSRSGFTSEERIACKKMIMDIEAVDEIAGPLWFRLPVPSIQMIFEACIMELPKP